MQIEAIVDELNKVCDFADRHYPSWDKRPQKLRELSEELSSGVDDRQHRIILAHIRDFLQGGMGSFGDVSLEPPAGSNVSYAELNLGFAKMRGKLYEKVVEALSETS